MGPGVLSCEGAVIPATASQWGVVLNAAWPDPSGQMMAAVGED